MAVWRKNPGINSDEAWFGIRSGVLGIVASSLGALFGLWVIYWGITRGHFAEILIGLLFSPILAFQTYMSGKMVLAGTAILQRKKKWLRTAVRCLAEIVDRSEERNESAETLEQEWICTMTLKLLDEFGAALPEPLVQVNVTKGTYTRCRHKNIIKVYRSPQDANLLMIEGE